MVISSTQGRERIRSRSYQGDDLGKMAWYIVRCVNIRGERGPVSETVGATIAA